MWQGGCFFSLSNILVCYSAAELAVYTVTVLPINKDAVQDDEWHYHPSQAKYPEMVNTAGAHMRYTESDKYIGIQRYKSKFSASVVHRVSVGGLDKNFTRNNFSRLAVECFTGSELGKLQVDHFNRNTDDNSKANLSAQGQLFQASNKNCQQPRDDGTHCGVFRVDTVKKPYWLVQLENHCSRIG
jgi:hypothetical protein